MSTIETTTNFNHDPITSTQTESLSDAVRQATVMELAAVVAGSRDFPDCRTPEKAAVRILAGREMGVGPIASVIGIRVQNGRVSMDAALMAGCIERSNKYKYRIGRQDNEGCVIDFYSEGQLIGQSSFTKDDAKTAGLLGKETWQKYPRNLYFARALSNGARWYCAGIFGGSIYNHEELGIAVDEDGRAVEGEAGGGAGNELCTRDQRQEIILLVEANGDSMPGFLAQLGIKLLDELSQYEAAKEIKNLEKRLAKLNGKRPITTNMVAPISAVTEKPLTEAHQMIADAEADAAQPSTERQREQIINLAEKLCPDENECREMLINAVTKRGRKKISELNHLQASILIESIRKKLEENPPFDPSPIKPGN